MTASNPAQERADKIRDARRNAGLLGVVTAPPPRQRAATRLLASLPPESTDRPLPVGAHLHSADLEGA